MRGEEGMSCHSMAVHYEVFLKMALTTTLKKINDFSPLLLHYTSLFMSSAHGYEWSELYGTTYANGSQENPLQWAQYALQCKYVKQVRIRLSIELLIVHQHEL